VEILGLMGDASDNIPGVPGIGPKGAIRLIEQFGGIEEILAHPEQIHNLKTREAILRNADQARLSRELAQIRTDAEIAFDIEACRRREPDRELLIALFKEFEFSSLLQELKINGEQAAGDYRIVRTPEGLEALVVRLGQVRDFSLDPVTSSGGGDAATLVGCPLRRARAYIPVPTRMVRSRFRRRDSQSLPFLATSPCEARLRSEDFLIVLSSGVSLRAWLHTLVPLPPRPAKHSFELADTALDHRPPDPAARRSSERGEAVRAAISAEKAADYACRRADAGWPFAALSNKIVAAD
jgi:DNA polymerase-1